MHVDYRSTYILLFLGLHVHIYLYLLAGKENAYSEQLLMKLENSWLWFRFYFSRLIPNFTHFSRLNKTYINPKNQTPPAVLTVYNLYSVHLSETSVKPAMYYLSICQSWVHSYSMVCTIGSGQPHALTACLCECKRPYKSTFLCS